MWSIGWNTYPTSNTAGEGWLPPRQTSALILRVFFIAYITASPHFYPRIRLEDLAPNGTMADYRDAGMNAFW